MSATSKLQRCPRLDSTKCWRLRSIIFEAVVVTARLLLLLSSLQLSIVYLVCIQYIVCYVAVQQQASKLNLIPSRFLSFIMIDLKAISAASFITKIITQPATSAPNYDYDSRSYSFLVPLAEFDWSLQIWNMMGVVSCATAAVLCQGWLAAARHFTRRALCTGASSSERPAKMISKTQARHHRREEGKPIKRPRVATSDLRER